MTATAQTGPKNKIAQLRDLFEGCFDYETAIAMVGLENSEGARIAWAYFGRNYRDAGVAS